MTLMRLRGTLVLIVAVACGGCATGSGGGVGVPNVHTVVPGVLVRGGQPDERGFAALRETYGIAAVVNLNDQTAEQERAMVEACGMKYVPLPSNAWRPESDKVLAFLRAVEESAGKGPVYVHCRHGMDRTGLAVAAYRITVQGWECERALAELKQYQAFPHGLMFPNIPPYVRNISRDREAWQERLAAGREDSPVQVVEAVGDSLSVETR